MVRKALIIVSLGIISVSTAACNTVRGVGEDLQSVANKVDDET